ncbi:MAG: DJ-1/PfpI family protein [Spirochaetales bacterium]|nr:DJ-1/PfpI family protein [Spirochaetales bacterium]
MSNNYDPAADYLEVVKSRGINIEVKDGATLWTGPKGGSTKDVGPLAGKKVGCLVASEFSDFQAYYVASYIGELGGELEYLLVDRVTWKWTRPNVRTKGVVGLWGLTVDPIPVGGGDKADASKSVYDADFKDYDAIIILGGPSGDIMCTEKEVQDLLENAYNNGAVIGGIGGGIIPMITVGLTNGKDCTGNEQVDFILKKTSNFKPSPVIIDDRVLTARDTIDTPEFVSALCRHFAPGYKDPRKGILTGKRMLLIAGWDFEDFEIAVPALEFMHRGANIVIGTFTGCKRARPPLLGLDVVQGNFGMSIPLQEIPDNRYRIQDLKDTDMDDFDGLLIPGAFCPWNMIEAGYPLEFLRKANEAGKVISFMCHGPIAIAAAGIAENRKSTGWISCTDAFTSQGGDFCADWSATIDNNIVSGRTTPELPEFIDAISIGLLRQ